MLFNRTLTDDELDLVKEHFFGIESNINIVLDANDIETFKQSLVK